MIYLYRPMVSEGAREVEDALNDLGTPARFTQGKLLRERFREGRDRVICWGAHLPGRTDAINNVPPMSKYQEALTLREKGVATVEVSATRPPVVPAGRGMYEFGGGGMLDEAGVRRMIASAQAWLDRPMPPPVEWLPRRNNHVGGSDLLRPPVQADYYSKKEDIVEEYRLHMFNGKSIRAGVKRRRDTRPDGSPSHEWIRSFDAGWIIAYEGFKSTKEQRELAARAVEALSLTFGAVDVARTRDGRLLVLEVNRAPGVEGWTADAYAQAIQTYVTGGANG